MAWFHYHDTAAGKKRDRAARKSTDAFIGAFTSSIKAGKKAADKYEREYTKRAKNAHSASDLKKARKEAKKAVQRSTTKKKKGLFF